MPGSLSLTLSLSLSPALCLSPSFPPACSLSPSLSPPLCPWGPSPFILTPRAITISLVTAGHVTCTCSSGWSPHAGAIWPHTHIYTHTRAHTHTHLAAFSPLFLLASSWPLSSPPQLSLLSIFSPCLLPFKLNNSLPTIFPYIFQLSPSKMLKACDRNRLAPNKSLALCQMMHNSTHVSW